MPQPKNTLNFQNIFHLFTENHFHRNINLDRRTTKHKRSIVCCSIYFLYIYRPGNCPEERCTGGRTCNYCGTVCQATCEEPNPPLCEDCSVVCECPDKTPIWNGHKCVTHCK